MHIITRKRILEFVKKHPDCSTALESWYRIVKRTDFNSLNELRQTFPSADIVGNLTVFNSLNELRQTFPSADIVGNLTVFNIGGNKARLIAAIHYNTHRIYIRYILAHKEYDRGSWRE